MNKTYIVNTNHPYLKGGIILKIDDNNTYSYQYLDGDNKKRKYYVNNSDIGDWLKQNWIFKKNRNNNTYKYKYSLDQIALAICDTLDIDLNVMIALNKKTKSILSRQLFSYFSKKLMPEYSYSDLAIYLRPEYPFNHSTIVYGKQKIESLLDIDKEITGYVKDISNILNL